MMGSEILMILLEATVASSLAISLVLVMRRPLRRYVGAGIACSAWMAVPLAVVAVLLPGAAATTPGQLPLMGAWQAAATGAVTATTTTGLGAAMPWLWLAGVLAFAAVLTLRQLRFLQRLRRRDESGEESGEPLGPAVVGLFRPRIVLPTDFARRYTPEEQSLVLEHEHEHVRRGDLPAQALGSLLTCLFWFNPLVHLAAARFRFDQELACDAAVLERRPRSRRCYGEAMFKTELAGYGLPVGCHWQSRHPLKERIAMLKNPTPSLGRRRFGSALVAAALVSGTFTVWAHQPGDAATDATHLQTLSSSDILTAPKYPAAAAKEGIEAVVVLDVLVGDDGVPSEVRVHSSASDAMFDTAAVEAAKQWRFNAGRAGNPGKKVEGWVRVPVSFRHDAPPASDTPG